MPNTQTSELPTRWKYYRFYVLASVFYCLCALSTNWDLFHKDEINWLRGGLNTTVATVESLVERGTFIIDDSPFVVTVDKMKVGEHFYSDKAPGFSLLLSPVYFVLYHSGLVITDQKFLTISLLTIFGVVIPGILSLYLFPKVARILFPESPLAHILTARNLLGFGTIMVSFSGTLNYHLMATFLLLAAVHIILVGSQEGASQPRTREIPLYQLTVMPSFSAGLLLGVLYTFDIPTGGIFLLMIGLFLIVSRQPKAFLCFIIGAIFPVLLYHVINYSIIGKLLPPFFYRQEFYQFDGSMHTANSLTGEKGTDHFFTLKRLYLIYRNFIGSVGLFSLSPVLILALLGYSKIWYAKSFPMNPPLYKQFHFFLAWGVILQILFYNCVVPSAIGTEYGVRHILPVIPFLMLGFIPFLAHYPPKKIFQGIIVLSILFSLGGAFQHKEKTAYLWGIRQFIPAYSFVDSIGNLQTYGK